MAWWRRLARTLNPSRPLARGFAEGRPSAEASTSGRSFEEAAAAAPGAAGRLSRWLDAPLLAPLLRPVQINQGTLALLLLGSVALGSQVDRVAHAQQAAAAGGGGSGATLWEAAAGLLPRLEAHSQQAAPAPSAPSAPSGAPLAGCLSRHFIADAAAKASPAVVNIQVVQPAGGGAGLFPVGSSGSGFVIDGEGTVLTNAHVVADPIARRKLGGAGAGITVTLQDGRTFPARLLASDAVSDIAVLRVDANVALPAIRLGTSCRLRAGEWVVALGSPLSLQNSVTAGIVSCVDRKAVELGLAGAWSHYIQTDAAISRGSSGGPLVSLDGEVVGITCMKALAADGVSFAIPIDEALLVMRQLLANGRVARPYIGIKMLQLSAANAAQLRSRDPLFPDVCEGVVVMAVNPNSPAAQAGLRPGDVITGFGAGAAAAGPAPATEALTRALRENIGKPLAVRVLRARGEAATVTVTAIEAPAG